MSRLAHVARTELGGALPHPGLYLLLDTSSLRVYVGESHDLQNRLIGHSKSPPNELRVFDKTIVLNDGRNSAHSLFNDHTLRLALEQSIMAALAQLSPWQITNRVRDSAPLSTSQKILFRHLQAEINYGLYQLRVLGALPRKRIPPIQVPPADAAKLFPDRQFSELHEYEGKVDGLPVYFRDGADKGKVGLPSHWQVTIPLGEPLGVDVREGRGYLCFNRGPVYLIPLERIRDWLGPKLRLQKPDIFFDIDEDKLTTAGAVPLDVSQFKAPKTSSG
jgi:hypothetical protein